MPVDIIYANLDDYAVTGSNADWATARATPTSTQSVSNTFHGVGAFLDFGAYYCIQIPLHFDTTGVVGTPTATSLVVVSRTIDGSGDTFEAMTHIWSGSGTGSFVAGDALVPDYGPTAFSTVGTKTLTKTNPSISITASYGVLLFAQRQRTNSAPAGVDYATIYSANESGTTNDPYLSITTVTTTNHPGAGVFNGAGTFSGAGRIVRNGSAAFAGAGSFTGSANLTLGGRAAFVGTGTFAGSGRLAAQGGASFAGQSTFTGSGNAAMLGAALFAGTGTFTARGGVTLQGCGSFAATSRFIATPKLKILQRSIGRYPSYARSVRTSQIRWRGGLPTRN